MSQTTVEFLVTGMKKLEIRVFENDLDKLLDLLEQSKKMFEEQIIEAYRMGRTDQQSDKKTGTYNRMAKQYFDETFNSK